MSTNPTVGLVADIFAVLDAHGYQRGDDSAVGASIILLADVVDAYEGRINSARLPRVQGDEEASR
ncbi:hypothetical protein [Nocardiopsis sp. L17-MgMaSL7]|uniref:hypothetical protein n=1 Tax=Nocardiopsis sp. L17-MgMaSL7 TaxID=1938893 RepID=UPI000D7118A4|nr:hypothetical protein [Nocardiopsis sp. L17-MgMaSL7]PWV49213.1 hypothetical protein BDW27_10967 [Nocardiopsis sp. L17-MgMaSL7]